MQEFDRITGVRRSRLTVNEYFSQVGYNVLADNGIFEIFGFNRSEFISLPYILNVGPMPDWLTAFEWGPTPELSQSPSYLTYIRAFLAHYIDDGDLNRCLRTRGTFSITSVERTIYFNGILDMFIDLNGVVNVAVELKKDLTMGHKIISGMAQLFVELLAVSVSTPDSNFPPFGILSDLSLENNYLMYFTLTAGRYNVLIRKISLNQLVLSLAHSIDQSIEVGEWLPLDRVKYVQIRIQVANASPCTSYDESDDEKPGIFQQLLEKNNPDFIRDFYSENSVDTKLEITDLIPCTSSSFNTAENKRLELLAALLGSHNPLRPLPSEAP